jgi:DNA-binding transcriptional regulator LsrR (DeoR family)
MVAAIQPHRTANTHVVQIIGGLGYPTAEVHASELCRRMANALQAQLILLPVPGIMHSSQAKEAVLSDTHIRATLNMFSQINVAYVGIGSPTPDSVMMRDGTIMSPNDLAEIKEKGAVGDIALRFFDAQGQPVLSDLDERVIGIRLEQLRQIDRVVGVSGGLKKVAAVRGALLGNFINILITDRKLAEALLVQSDLEDPQPQMMKESY